MGPYLFCLRALSFVIDLPLYCRLANDMLSLLSKIQLDILASPKIPYFWACQTDLARALTPCSVSPAAIRSLHRAGARAGSPSRRVPAPGAAAGRRRGSAPGILGLYF